MKKFSEMNNNKDNSSTMTSTNNADFIKNLVSESLTIKDDKIEGIDNLINTLIELIDINESKSIIKTLESVKIKSFKHLNMNWINESISAQKSILKGEKEEVLETINESLIATKTEVKEELVTEKVETEECTDCKDDDIKKPEVEEEEKTDIENDEEETEIKEALIANTVNFMTTDIVREYLEDNGFAIYENESIKELKDILVKAIKDGEIKLKDTEESFVTETEYVAEGSVRSISDVYTSIMNESVKVEEDDNSELNFKGFKEMFGVQMNQFTNESIVFGYITEELDFVESKIFENKIATIIEIDGTKTLKNGFLNNNRTGFIVTEKPIDRDLNINLKR